MSIITLSKKVFLYPGKRLTLFIPLALLIGFVSGLFFDTSALKDLILFITFMMIYPTMIGVRLREIFSLDHGKLLAVSVLINFIFVPLLAYFLGRTFLLGDPELFAGLAIASLLPTANMTPAFTMLARGNVPAAIKLTIFSLVVGSLLAPWYLLVMVGKYVPIDLVLTIKTIAIVVFIPLILGALTYNLIRRKYTEQKFNQQIKPFLPAVTAWGLMFIIFISISMKSKAIITSLEIFVSAFGVQIIFYLANYLLATLVARLFFARADGFALVYSCALRNLSISIGLAATAFGSHAALMVALAYIIQGQAAIYFNKLNDRFEFLPDKKTGVKAL